MVRFVALFCTLFLTALTPSFATTYYVSPSGNDLFLGTIPLLPWATIARVNSANLRSGDTVYFQRGGTWRETIIPQVSGLRYGAYGSGATPVISGADQLKNPWKSLPNNVWSYKLGSIAPSQVWFSGVLGTQASSTSALLAPLQWFYSQGTLYVYSTVNPVQTTYLGPIPIPISTTYLVEATQRATSLMINNVSSLTVENLSFVNTGLVGACLCSGNSGQANFNGDTFSGAFNEGLSVYSGVASIKQSELINNGVGLYYHSGTHFTLSGSVVSGNANQGVLVATSNAYNQIDSSTITGNATDNAASETITNLGPNPLQISNSVLLPNPYMPKVESYSGITDLGNNVFQSPYFKVRSAPAIVVPFIDDYINLAVAQAVSKVAYSYGCPISYALNTKLVTPAAWTQIAQMQASYGVEVVAHTRSHSDLANNNVFSIQYTGPATSAVMTINQTTHRLQTFLNGSTVPDLDLDLSDTFNGVTDVLGRIPAGSNYTVIIQPNQLYFTPINLAAVSNIDIKSSSYLAHASANYLTWEVEGAQADIAANLPGYKVKSFATPFTSSNLTVENHIRDAGFIANRNGTLTADWKPNGNWLLSNLDVYNMASEFLPLAFDASKPVSSSNALVEGLGAAGGVMAVYAHGYDEFTLQDWTRLFANLKATGATCMTMSQANAYIKAKGTLVPDGTNKNWCGLSL